jgi:hypothetical protein
MLRAVIIVMVFRKFFKKRRDAKKKSKLEENLGDKIGRVKELNLNASTEAPKKAIKLYDEAIGLGNEIGAHDLVLDAHFGKAGVYSSVDNYAAAKQLYNQVRKEYLKNGNVNGIQSADFRLEEIAGKEGGLEHKFWKKVGLAAVAFCFLVSIFFISQNITGNVVLGNNLEQSYLFGATLFFIGTVGSYSLLRKR